MRVIAGSARRLLLKTIEGMDTRPTTDRIKETLFNMLNTQIPGCTFLDLFSGSGAIGIEALSRGAKQAFFVESNPEAVSCIRENLSRTHLEEGALVLNCDVIAGRGNAIAGEKLLHPNDHSNMSQSSNDTFPTAMHIAAVMEIEDKLFPAIDRLTDTFTRLMAENEGIVKTGRTHLQDATPISFSQEISGWREMLIKSKAMLTLSLKGLHELALGGTAVGTGLNAPKGFDTEVAKAVAELTGKDFVTAPNKFHSLTSKDELVFAHGALKGLAADMMKMANDIRWLSSGPRCGLGEIFIPENEPGSSIMPGKVNPTQCESVTMVAVQIIANDTAVGMAASQGNFELNVFMPVCIYNFLQSVRLLTDSLNSFNDRCVSGIHANREKMDENLHRSLMLVTCLNPYIGYENAAKTAKKAYKENISLKEACVELGFLTAEKFDEIFHPEQMV